MLAAQQQRAAAGLRGSRGAHVAEALPPRCSALLTHKSARASAAPVLPPRAPCHLDSHARRRVLAAAASPGRRHLQQQTTTEEEEEEEEEETEAEAEQAVAAQAAVAATDGEASTSGQQQQPQQQEGAEVLPAETEAVAAQVPQMVTEEFVEEVEQIIEPLTFRSALTSSQAFVSNTWQGKLLVGGVAAVFLGTLAVAAMRTWERANTARAKRMRQIDRNRDLVDGLNKFLLAGNRAGLSQGELKRLQRASGFTAVEVFRKYLWYLLRERKFDQGAVEDLVALKSGLGLSDADAGEALRERSNRIYEKYGSLMLNTEGLTLAGAQRKASCMALFRKVLYLAETARLVGPVTDEGGSGNVADIGKIFGATHDDMERLRIRNLYEAELDLEAMVVDTEEEEGEGEATKEPPAPPASGDKK